MLTIYGACVVSFMMCMYALEGRHPLFVLAFALGCAMSSSYGFLSGTWPFGVVEAIWSLVAAKRYWDQRDSDDVAASLNADPITSSTPLRAGSSIEVESNRSDVR